MSARVVQRYVLDKINDERLRTYVVWGPMLGYETEEHAQEAPYFLNDSRSNHFWTDAHDLAKSLEPILGLEDEPAWDVFLVYEPGVTWGETPPKPDFYMHHGRSLPDELRLNGVKLYEQLSEMLASSTAETVVEDAPKSGD